MSRTKRDVVKGRYKRAKKEFTKKYGFRYAWQNQGETSPWDVLSYKEQICIASWKNPSWWNKLFGIVPARRRDRDLLRKYDVHFDAEVDHLFSINKKPHQYYY